MSDNQRYREIFYKAADFSKSYNCTNDGIDAVVAAVRAEYYTADEMYDNGYTDARHDAARRIRADSWFLREYGGCAQTDAARIAEGSE